jgi:arsenite oxidase small subunit
VNRRGFVTGCIVATCVPGTVHPGRPHAGPQEAGPPYPRAMLVDERGSPLLASRLAPHTPYCFMYPYVSTPCLLIDLAEVIAPREVAGDPRPGGVGPGRSIVAYTAICPHEWSHPEPEFSPVYYVAPGQRAVLAGGRDRLIVCCSHGSVFDPAAGGAVEQSPARVPLASILLEWDAASGGLIATGVSGPVSFEQFFASFDRDGRLVSGPVRVVALQAYSKAVGRC